MKKLAILLLAFTLLCSCFVLAACGGDGDESSASNDSSSTATSSDDTKAPSTATSSDESSASAPVEESSNVSTEESGDDSSVADEPSDDPNGGDVAGEGELLWLTHYNTLANEGSGVVLSSEYTGGNWWIHVSFKPVDGQDGVYEIAEIKDGLAEGSGGSGSPLAIPDGGFVYALNAGNDYPNIDGSGPDYTSAPCNNMLTAMRTWKVGDKFTFTGIDFENFTEIPTSTPNVNWYEDAANDSDDTDNYVCTATFTKLS